MADVVDGDTLKAGGWTIRLIGIDAPERGQCGYDEATSFLYGLVTGAPVRLSAVKGRADRDRYGRLLRYVTRGDGQDVGLAMIEGAHAVARYDGRDGYGTHPRQGAYVKAQRVADAGGWRSLRCPPSTSDARAPFRNCAEARAAGVPLPLTPAHPRWNARLDRDGDRRACESR